MPRGSARAPRAPASLSAPPISSDEVRARDSEVRHFRRSLADEFDFDTATPELLVPVLLDYAQLLYDSDQSLGRLRRLLLGIQDLRWDLKGRLGRAWDAVRVWESLEPTTSHTPVPLSLFRAMVTVSLLLRWVDVAVMLVFMFAGLMRPGEAVMVSRSDVVLPSDLVAEELVVFIRIARHKTVRKAGRQHAVIRDPEAVRFLERALHRLDGEVRIFAFSPPTFRKRWDAVCGHIGVVSGGLGFTPASLRAGGATHLYQRGVPVSEIRWLLRHAGDSSTAHYIQEAAAALAAASLPRDRVAILARASRALLRSASSIPPQPTRQRLVRFNLRNVVWTEDEQ